MKRRNFLKASMAAPVLLTACNTTKPLATTVTTIPKFNMKFAPHIGMFKNIAGEDPIDQIKFMADQGFTAFEDNSLKNREVALQEKMGQTLAQLNMEMGVFVGGRVKDKKPTVISNDESIQAEFLKRIRASVEASKRVNAKWMTVLLGRKDLKQDMGYQTANAIEILKRACGILEPHGLVMVLEPLNFYNHPGLFLTKISQAFQICKAVNSPSCKILFDIYHQQIQEGNLIPNIDMAWDEIGYFQIGDNPGRKEPTTGEINYKNIFKHIHEKGFKGILGMEHGNFNEGVEGEKAVIKAYREVDVRSDL